MIQHLRACHRDVPDVVRDFPDTPGKKTSKAQEKRMIAQSSIIEALDFMCPKHPENRIAIKITDCLSDYCSLNNRTLDIVNDIGLIRVLAAANPRYQLYSRTYMTKTKLPRRYAAAVRTCLLYTSPSPRDGLLSRMPSSA